MALILNALVRDTKFIDIIVRLQGYTKADKSLRRKTNPTSPWTHK